jgi:hypothetical protein
MPDGGENPPEVKRAIEGAPSQPANPERAAKAPESAAKAQEKAQEKKAPKKARK